MISDNDLRRIGLFKDLPAAELESLAGLLQTRRVDRGAFIVTENDPTQSIMFLVRGEAKATLLSDDGKEVVITLLEEGSFFGELALLTGEKRSANVVATSECTLFVLQAEDLYRHLQTGSALALAMLRELAHRLRTASAKIGHLALYDVYERTAKTLLGLSERTERDGKPLWIVDKRPTHQELASMCGTSREMVTRALKGLEDAGFCLSLGKRVEIFREKP